MVATKETSVYRRDASKGGQLLTPSEREELLKPYLPSPPTSKQLQDVQRKPFRDFLKTQLHVFTFTVIHTIFSIYIRLRQIYHAVVNRILSILYYHHRTPELIRKDIRALDRLPQHLSVILELRGEEFAGAGLDTLLDEVAELSAWCACVGIPMLSIYEKTGILKSRIPTTHRIISSKMHSYFGRSRPSLQVRAPHMPSFLNGDVYEESASATSPDHLSVLLLSADDGQSTLVDLTKTLTEMSQRDKLSTNDISVELIDAEISESIMGEPNLLILFGPDVQLQGYPPWQIHLTEIFHVQDNNGVEYEVFLRALHKFAKAQMRFGR